MGTTQEIFTLQRFLWEFQTKAHNPRQAKDLSLLQKKVIPDMIRELAGHKNNDTMNTDILIAYQVTLRKEAIEKLEYEADFSCLKWSEET